MAEATTQRRRHAYPFAQVPDEARHGGPFAADKPPGLVRRARVVRRLVAALGWTAVCIPVQALLLPLPGRAKAKFPRQFWAVFTRALGIRVRRVGDVLVPDGKRPIVYVSNHSSWVDIAVLGGILEGCFIAKEDVSRWPVISTVARLGRTIFVSRQRNTTAKERDEMQAVLDRGEALVLFPEGTTSDGARVLPFRTPFFAVAMGENAPILQPVSIVYDRLGGLPLGRSARPVFAWYGDMDIASHFGKLGQLRGMRVTVVLHEPVDPKDFRDRKELAQAVWDTVAHGAATLRQNREARPLPVARPVTDA
jgi:1-acyl-sn-glycerol-3-phosphate acyltransferase